MARPKGAPNKTTVAVKDALLDAFSGIGGQQRFNTWAGANETEFYKLFVKLLPVQLSGDSSGGPVQIVIKTGVERHGD